MSSDHRYKGSKESHRPLLSDLLKRRGESVYDWLKAHGETPEGLQSLTERLGLINDVAIEKVPQVVETPPVEAPVESPPMARKEAPRKEVKKTGDT